METGPRFIVSSEWLEERRIESATLGLQGQHANHCAKAGPIISLGQSRLRFQALYWPYFQIIDLPNLKWRKKSLYFFFRFKGPVIIVPTKFYKTPTQVFQDLGISMVIWANHNMRATIRAIQETSAQIYKDQSLVNVEPKVRLTRSSSLLWRFSGFSLFWYLPLTSLQI